MATIFREEGNRGAGETKYCHSLNPSEQSRNSGG
jgi:hypothetical protein